MQRREPGGVRPLAHAAIDLSGDDHLLAPPAALDKPAPEDVLGDAFADLPAVNVSRIEEVDAQFERLVHDGEGIGFAGLRAEVHRAETKAGHFQAGAAKLGEFHACLQKESTQRTRRAQG